MTRKRRRLWILLLCAVGLGSSAALVLSAFSDNLVFFVSPSDLAKAEPNGRTGYLRPRPRRADVGTSNAEQWDADLHLGGHGRTRRRRERS